MAALVLGAMTFNAKARTSQWTASTSGTWSDPTNWTVPSPLDDLLFTGDGMSMAPITATNDISNNIDYKSITFDTGAPTFTLSGSAIGLFNGIVNNSSVIQTISFADFDTGKGGVYVKLDQSWLATTGSLLITSDVTSYNSDGFTPTIQLTIGGVHNTTISGFINEDNSNGAVVLSITKNGTGALSLNGSNSYTGATTLNAGQLNLNNASAIGSGTLTIYTATTLDNTSGGAITLTTNNAQIWAGNFTFAGSNDLNLGTGAVTLNLSTIQVTVSAGNLTIGGTIDDASAGYGITKAGAGTLTLSGSDSYTGATTVNAGTLVVSGSLTATGTTTVADGATLQLVGGSLINSAATVTVGAATLNLTGGQSSVGTVVLNDGATFQARISSTADGSHAILSSHGGVTLTGAVSLSINSTGYTPVYTLGDLTGSDKFVLILGNGTPTTGTFANLSSVVDTNYGGLTLNEYTDLNGNTWAIFYNVTGTDYTTAGTGDNIVAYAIPEPSTYAMMLGSFGILIFVQRLRRRSV